MATRKWTTVAVRVSRQRLARWRGAAHHGGAPSAAAWLSRLATERLRHLGRYVPRRVLRWRRSRFKALRLPYFNAPEATLQDVSGLVAGPFGIYKDREREDIRPRMP